METWHPLTPRTWQLEAWNAWEKQHYGGTVEATTAAGKTYLGAMVLHKFASKRVLIVVPTIPLMYQWQKEMETNTALKGINVGLVGDGHHDIEKHTVVAVVNSIREADLKGFPIVILDEAHRYMSIVNRLFLHRHDFPVLLALTATMKRDDGLHKEFLEKYPCVYKVSQKDGIDAGWLCKYSVINMPCPLLPEEQEVYNKAHNTVRTTWHKYKSLSAIQSAMRQRDMTAVGLMRAIGARRKILMNSATKIIYAANIILKNPEKKTIVFGEYKNAAEKLYKILKRHGIDCAIYHSGMTPKKRIEMLEKFKNDEFKIMISVKALDEGLNVPTIERAIIIGGSKVERQMIQRLGRILRGIEGKHALVIQLFIPDTKDETWVRERTAPLQGVAEKIVWLTSSVLPAEV